MMAKATVDSVTQAALLPLRGLQTRAASTGGVMVLLNTAGALHGPMLYYTIMNCAIAM
jgi:hypothetical protein